MYENRTQEGKVCWELGKLFAEMRKARGITQGAVAEHLLTQRAVSEFEQNGALPSPLVFHALMMRLGNSTQFFMTMLTQREYEYLCWKEDILKKIEQGKVKSEDWDTPMARSRQLHEALQGQFVEFWKGYTSKDIQMMDRAITRTVSGYPGPLSTAQCISSEELRYMLLSVGRRLEDDPAQWSKVKGLLLSMLHYIENNYIEEEQVKVYGKAVCLYGSYVLNADGQEKVVYYKKALEVLRRQAVLTGMCDILKGLLGLRDHLAAEECREYECELHALEWVKAEFQVEEQSLIRGELNQEFCLLNEVLGAYRRERGLRVRDIDEHVCSEKTYRALETGKRDAKKGTYLLLADYMQIPLGSYSAEIISDSYEEYLLVEKIKRLLHEQQDACALAKLDELEERLGDKAAIRQNAQFIASVRDIIFYEEKKITLEEYQQRVERAIRFTIPEWNVDYQAHFYTQREMTLVYYEASINRKMKNYDVAIRLLERLWEQLEQSRVAIIHRIDEALLINTLWKNLLTDVGKYERAMERVKIGVELSFAAGRGDFLDQYVFEPGWIINAQQENLSQQENLKCLNYFRSALYISKLFYRRESQKIIHSYCNTNGFDLLI